MSEQNKACYAQVGIVGRARMYYEALHSECADRCELVVLRFEPDPDGLRQHHDPRRRYFQLSRFGIYL